MKALYNGKSECCGCGACAAVCPENAVLMKSDAEGFLYPETDAEKCINCGVCAAVCPMGNREAACNAENTYFAVKAKHDGIRNGSSSGGAFPVLADRVIKDGGTVYGAAFDRDMRVYTRGVRDGAELSEFYGTKYVQSDMSGVFETVKNDLENGRKVLFSGTPCETDAMRRFAGKDNENLILCSLICYGVPSPQIWADYIAHLERKYKGRVTDFKFRDKRNGDDGHTCSCRVKRKNGTEQEFSWSIYEDKFCKLYFKNLTLRPSCHKCAYCTVNRNSDLTLGDFWGIENFKPEWHDGMGTSVVIAHTHKGRELIEKAKDGLNISECTVSQAMQPRLVSPTPVSDDREQFMERYKSSRGAIFAETSGRSIRKRLAAVKKKLFLGERPDV